MPEYKKGLFGWGEKADNCFQWYTINKETNKLNNE